MLEVLISSIDICWTLPYQWALLKTYAEEEPALANRIIWRDPFHFPLSGIARAMKDGQTLTSLGHLDQVDVLGLSCYVWNLEIQLEIAKAVKALNPRCLVVAGGPHLDYGKADCFDSLPGVDVIVKKDGEIPFRKILAAMVEGRRDFHRIPGLVLKEGDRARDTGPAEVLPRFDRSPWLSNLDYLEKWAEKAHRRGEPIEIICETNRGCPYACAYCNWASNTMSKVRCFDLENIREEIRWFGKIKAAALNVADANFGILPRDLEISACLEGLSTEDHKTLVFFSPAKNNPDRVIPIARSLFRAGLIQRLSLGIQTTEAESLAAIGRTNIGMGRLKTLADALMSIGVPLCAEVIMGCPGETLESWKKTVTDVFEIGIDDVSSYFFHLLPNTPANEASYRKKWQIKTIHRRDFAQRAKSEHVERGYPIEFIYETSTFTRDEFAEMGTYAAMITGLHRIEAVNAIARDFRRRGFRYLDFYNDLFEGFFKQPQYSVAHQEYCRIRDLFSLEDSPESQKRFIPIGFWGKKGEIRWARTTHYLTRKYPRPDSPLFRELQAYLQIRYTCRFPELPLQSPAFSLPETL